MGKDKVTIYDVAERLGISTATVNRVINNKPNVSENTRRRVLAAIEEMGYRPSKTAASLSRAPIYISVLIAASISEFHSEIERGARFALDELFDFNVRGGVRVIEKREEPDEFIAAMYEEADAGADAIALVCHKDEAGEIQAMNDISKRDIRFAVGVSEVDVPSNTFSVKSNGIVAGRMAAELLENMLGSGKVALVVGDKGTNVHDVCRNGFEDYIKDSELEMAGCYESHEDEGLSAALADIIIKEHPDIAGVYISSANSIGFLKRLVELGKERYIRVVTSDIFPALAEYMDKGAANASIFQDPFRTGYKLVSGLYERMTDPMTAADKLELTDPQAVLVSNKELFLKNMCTE